MRDTTVYGSDEAVVSVYIHNNIYRAALEQGKMNNASELDNSKATNTQAK